MRAVLRTLRLSWIILRESLLHPGRTTYIDTETFAVTHDDGRH